MSRARCDRAHQPGSGKRQRPARHSRRCPDPLPRPGSSPHRTHCMVWHGMQGRRGQLLLPIRVYARVAVSVTECRRPGQARSAVASPAVPPLLGRVGVKLSDPSVGLAVRSIAGSRTFGSSFRLSFLTPSWGGRQCRTRREALQAQGTGRACLNHRPCEGHRSTSRRTRLSSLALPWPGHPRPLRWNLSNGTRYRQLKCGALKRHSSRPAALRL